MTTRKKHFLVVLLILSLPVFTSAQKAYDAYYYKGSTQNISVSFTLADGYIAACELKTTDLTSKKTSSFLPETGAPDEMKRMKFYHYSTSGKKFTDYFIIDGMEEMYDSLPKIIYGKYYFNNSSYPLVLTINTCK